MSEVSSANQKQSGSATTKLVPTSLRAVSEAPISRQVVESRCSGGALRIQRLEGSRRSREQSMVSYVVEQVPMICEVAIAASEFAGH
jgi:hypothetical protein